MLESSAGIGRRYREVATGPRRTEVHHRRRAVAVHNRSIAGNGPWIRVSAGDASDGIVHAVRSGTDVDRSGELNKNER